MTFNPLCFQRASEFFVKILDDGEYVDIVRLDCWSVVFSCD